MSAEAVSQFLQTVTVDQSLQIDLLKAMQAESDREAVTQLENEKGFEFTSEELWAEVRKRQQEFESRQAAAELSDEELEAVAGGASPLVTVIIGVVISGGTFAAGYGGGKAATW